jgi:multisubunit Na+/H+ antiporter MnhF subunit
MMTNVWWLAACGLLVNIAIGLGFLTSREGNADSLLAALLLGTAGVAFALVLGAAIGEQRAVDIALVFSLLAAVLGVAFVRRGWTDSSQGEGSRR